MARVALYFFVATVMAAGGAASYFLGAGFGRMRSKHDLALYALLCAATLCVIIYQQEIA